MTKFNNFDEIVNVMPYHLRKITLDLKSMRERPDYHPEESVYEHIRIVVERILSLPESYEYKWDLVAAAIFHDIGKKITAKPNYKLEEKLGGIYPTSPGHDKFGAELATLNQNWIFETFGVSPIIATWVCAQHMRIAQFANMKNSKKKAYFEEPFFAELCVFHQADNMLENFSKESMYNTYNKYKDILLKKDEKRNI